MTKTIITMTKWWQNDIPVISSWSSEVDSVPQLVRRRPVACRHDQPPVPGRDQAQVYLGLRRHSQSTNSPLATHKLAVCAPSRRQSHWTGTRLRITSILLCCHQHPPPPSRQADSVGHSWDVVEVWRTAAAVERRRATGLVVAADKRWVPPASWCRVDPVRGGRRRPSGMHAWRWEVRSPRRACTERGLCRRNTTALSLVDAASTETS